MRSISFPLYRLCSLLLAFSIFTAGSLISGAQTGARARIAGKIDEHALVALQGNTPRLAGSASDLGPAPSGALADRLLLILRRSAEQEAALQAYLTVVQDPNSPQFGKFISPEQFGRLYGVSDADIQVIRTWLESHGFAVSGVNKGHTVLEFSGTLDQVQQAFHVSIHNYSSNGVQHWANSGNPAIPAALAPVVGGLSTLNDLKPRPMAIRGPRGNWDEQQRRFSARVRGTSPQLTGTISGSSLLFVVPGDAATIYDAPDTLNRKLPSGQTTYDGTGVSIGVVGDTDLDFTSVLNYRSFFGLPGVNTFSIVRDGSSANFDPLADQTEAILDSEVSGALAPGAHVTLYTAGDTLFQSGVLLAINRAIDDNAVSILSVSFGFCESDLGAAGNLQILNAWQQAAAQGITVVVAAGDSGSAGCDDFNTQASASKGFAVSGFASTPYNIAVGGTDFDRLPSSFSTYVSKTNSSNYTSALGYIPEEPWNNSTKVNGSYSSNQPYTDTSGHTNIVAGGGGPSTLGSVSGTGAPQPYPKPVWQQGLAASNKDSVRDLPDVSLFAGSGLYNAVWAICNPNDCSGSSPTISGVGGTSASAPAFAGMLAIVNQRMGASTRLGQANWVLYRLAQSAPNVFHSLTSGNNSVFCAAGTPDCGSNDFLSGFNAGAGFSFATGLGSVDVAQLAANWNQAPLTPTTTTLTLDQVTFVHGTPVNMHTTVTPSAATGDVAIVNNSKSQALANTSSTPASIHLSGGAGEGSFSQFPGGTYNVYANYNGDGVYAGSTSQPVQVTVSPENSFLHMTAASVSSTGTVTDVSGMTLPLGTLISINAQPIAVSQQSSANPITDATGAVVFYDPVGNSVTLDSSGNAEWNRDDFTAGAHALTAVYTGDPSYNGSTAPAVNFTIAQAPTAIAVTSTAATISFGTANITAQVTANVPASFLIYGAVTFTDLTNNTVLGTTSPGSGCGSKSLTLCGTTAMTVNVNQLAIGANSIVASYGGDTNFLASGTSAPVILTCTAGCSNGTGQTLQLAFYQSTPSGPVTPGTTTTTPVDVSPGGGFTGAVNLTCSISGTSGNIHLPTCSFNPAQVSITNTQSAESSLIINTTVATTSSLMPAGMPWYAPTGAGLAGALLLCVPSRHRRRRHLLGAVVLVAIFMSLSACGGGAPSSSSGGGLGTTKPGTSADIYTVTFKAADAVTGTVTALDYFTFTVK
jgi:subtilase family serine protease